MHGAQTPGPPDEARLAAALLAEERRNPAERLVILAREIARLAPNWRDPERYFEARSELAEEARRLARVLER